MAIGTPALCMTPDNTGGLGSKAYALTTTSGNVVIVLSGCELSTGDPAIATIGDTAGWTWGLQYDVTYSTGSNPRLRQQIWTAISNGSANTVTVTHGDGGVNPIGWLGAQVSGASATLINFCNGQNIAGDPGITFPSGFTTGGVACGMLLAAQNNALTCTGATMAVVGAQQPYATNSGRLALFFDATSPASAHAWTSTNLATMCLGFEIQEPAAGGIVGNPYFHRHIGAD